MAKLGPIHREQICDSFIIETPYEGPLPALGDTKKEYQDDSFVLYVLAAPGGDTFAEDELLEIYVNDGLSLRWPVLDLRVRYRRFAELSLPVELTEMAKAIERLATLRQSDFTDATTLAEGWATAAAKLVGEPGIKLPKAIGVPSRSTLKVVCTAGASIRVHFAGLRRTIDE